MFALSFNKVFTAICLLGGALAHPIELALEPRGIRSVTSAVAAEVQTVIQDDSPRPRSFVAVVDDDMVWLHLCHLQMGVWPMDPFERAVEPTIHLEGTIGPMNQLENQLENQLDSQWDLALEEWWLTDESGRLPGDSDSGAYDATGRPVTLWKGLN